MCSRRKDEQGLILGHRVSGWEPKEWGARELSFYSQRKCVGRWVGNVGIGWVDPRWDKPHLSDSWHRPTSCFSTKNGDELGHWTSVICWRSQRTHESTGLPFILSRKRQELGGLPRIPPASHPRRRAWDPTKGCMFDPGLIWSENAFFCFCVVRCLLETRTEDVNGLPGAKLLASMWRYRKLLTREAQTPTNSATNICASLSSRETRRGN